MAARSSRHAQPVGVTTLSAQPGVDTPLIMRRSGSDSCHAGAGDAADAVLRGRARLRPVRGGEVG